MQPDEGNHLQCLDGATPVLNISRMFLFDDSVGPLCLSMWACLWHDAIQHFSGVEGWVRSASLCELREAVADYTYKHQLPPCPYILVKCYARLLPGCLMKRPASQSTCSVTPPSSKRSREVDFTPGKSSERSRQGTSGSKQLGPSYDAGKPRAGQRAQAAAQGRRRGTIFTRSPSQTYVVIVTWSLTLEF